MLIITRKKEEQIRFTVGELSFTIMVVDVAGKRARIGIDAPMEVVVSRPEKDSP